MEITIGIIAAALIRLTALVLAYLVVKLGHDTLVKGIKGDFRFASDGQGMKVALESASPGLLFVILGVGLGAWAITVDKPLGVEFNTFVQTSRPSTNANEPIRLPATIPDLSCDPITKAGCDDNG
jgi:hypothetical protein